MRIILAFIGILVFVDAQADSSYAARLQKVEAFAKRVPDFTSKYDLVIESAGDCGAGNFYYVKRGQLSNTEFNWLRQLLSYRFNGTSVVGKASIQIDFEEVTETQVTDQEVTALASGEEFSKWIGSDLIKSMAQLKAARSQLLVSTQKYPPIPEQFIKSKAFNRYYSVANVFYERLASKFNIISVDNLVDCD